MNAQEHYRAAEHLISAPESGPRPKEHDVALAQVHALLALTATLAENNQSSFHGTPAFPLPTAEPESEQLRHDGGPWTEPHVRPPL